DIPGATSISAAISPILPTKTLLSPGAIARSTMVMPRVRRWVHFHAEPALSGSKIWRGLAGNRTARSLRNTNQRSKAHRRRAQASHFIEDAFRVQLAFQPLERAIHWFAFSNNDFWHQFTSIPKNSPIPTVGKANLLRPSTPRQMASRKAF